jgi:pimeloyl-ACP methyl ester carboxylesterase
VHTPYPNGGRSGHSTGGGEVTRYIGRHGTSRVAKALLLAAIPPLMLKTSANPAGTPMEVFDAIREGIRHRPFAVLPGSRRWCAVVIRQTDAAGGGTCRSSCPTGWL